MLVHVDVMATRAPSGFSSCACCQQVFSSVSKSHPLLVPPPAKDGSDDDRKDSLVYAAVGGMGAAAVRTSIEGIVFDGSTGSSASGESGHVQMLS